MYHSGQQKVVPHCKLLKGLRALTGDSIVKSLSWGLQIVQVEMFQNLGKEQQKALYMQKGPWKKGRS